jgi:hypothetical protein
MNEVDIGEIIRESSSTMATETVDTLRVQGMRADRLLGRTVDRVLGAAKSDRPALVSSAALKVHATVTGRYGTRHFAGCTPSGRTHLHQMKPIGPPGASIEPDERRRREGINPTVYG